MKTAYMITGILLGLLVILRAATESEMSPMFMYIVGISLIGHSIQGGTNGNT